ncbi:MAG: hypothetical protein EBT82_00175 [Micrococcales bacterium]|nr:hypothetical protein [Micrococcales bacterium]NBR60333.1 hypothetical protein [Actinomycetota bacterium]NBR54396.1 hypothetical protein [Micrococcales bacterium]NBT46231.1 hypothetical protein [Actinomycetota bacterium]NBY43503.1 hypothetical protein [Micrococcales bacterium]
MTIAARALPLARPVAPRRHLRPVSSTSTPAKRVATTRSLASSQNLASLVKRGVIGLVLVLLANLAVAALCNQSIYQISSLKQQNEELGTQTQVVQQQVDSLRSPQNLANSARSLGMIVNSNPVFLKVATGKVLGSAQAASFSSASAISSNLIANAALISRSNPTKSTAPTMDIPTSTSVKSLKTGAVQVVLPSVGIPASPTH